MDRPGSRFFYGEPLPGPLGSIYCRLTEECRCLRLKREPTSSEFDLLFPGKPGIEECDWIRMP